MTTLLLSEIFPPRTGGSGRWFWEIYGRLPREQYVVAAGEHPRQGEFDRGHDLRVVRLPLTLESWGVCGLRSIWAYGRIVRRLRGVVAAHGIERVHCGRCLPEGVMALALRWWTGVPYLCYVHGEDVNTASTSRELRWLVRRVLHGADFVIPNSRNTSRLLTEEWGLSPDRVRLLHPGVDTERFLTAGRDPAARRALGWGERPVLLTVGRLQKRKGHDVLIRALPSLRRTVPGLLYAIVGDGEERQGLEELAVSEGVADAVHFLGEVEDEQLVTCYQQCDMFVLPNRQVGKDIEGFGMVLLEAQACGRPVVAGASGGTAETMRIPETGRVVNCDGPDELAVLLGELLARPEALDRMGRAAREWVVSKFDWTVLARQADEVFTAWGGIRGSAAVRPVEVRRETAPHGLISPNGDLSSL